MLCSASQSILTTLAFLAPLMRQDAGEYAGFDPTCFTSRSGGKKDAVVHLKATRGFKTVIMVGDGATDAEAKAPGGADIFIGYGGVVHRRAVEERADWYILDLKDLLAALQATHTD